MKLQETTTGSLMVCIPKDLVELIKWEKGDRVVITPSKEGSLQIRKV